MRRSVLAVVSNVGVGGGNEFIGGLEIGDSLISLRFVPNLILLGTVHLLGIEDTECPHQVERLFLFFVGHRFFHWTTQHDSCSPLAGLHVSRSSHHRAPKFLPLVEGRPPPALVLPTVSMHPGMAYMPYRAMFDKVRGDHFRPV